MGLFRAILQHARVRAIYFLESLTPNEEVVAHEESRQTGTTAPASVADTLTPEARQMIEEGRAHRPREEKKVPAPLKGSAADIIARRNASRPGG